MLVFSASFLICYLLDYLYVQTCAWVLLMYISYMYFSSTYRWKSAFDFHVVVAFITPPQLIDINVRLVSAESFLLLLSSL